MPIICEDYNGSTKKSAYLTVNKFVLAYPETNPPTPLGPDYQFSKQFLPLRFKKFADEIENFDVRPDDLNFEKAKKESLQDRCPYIEYDIVSKVCHTNAIKTANNLPSPRHLKSHLLAGLLPKQLWTVKPKIIYVARGVKDLAVSFYHHYVHLQGYTGTLDEFLEAFIEDKVFLAPHHGHVKDFWHLRNEENVLFITYEEMKSHLMAVLKKTAQFLGKNYSDEDLKKLEKHLAFDEMKVNKNVNFSKLIGHVKLYTGITRFFSKNANGKGPWSFMRKGKVGSYKEDMSPDMIERFDKWTTEFNEQNGTSITL